MRALLLVMLACSPSCTTTATSSVSSIPTPEVRLGARARAWEVRSAGECLGFVVLFQEHGHADDSVYVVRNAWHQDLGLIDGLGRAFRYLPHAQEPVWVGSGTIATGAARIFGAAAECALVELDPQLRPLRETRQSPSAEPAPLAVFDPVARPSGAPAPEGGLPQSD